MTEVLPPWKVKYRSIQWAYYYAATSVATMWYRHINAEIAEKIAEKLVTSVLNTGSSSSRSFPSPNEVGSERRQGNNLLYQDCVV